jgi:hypothetical protein
LGAVILAATLNPADAAARNGRCGPGIMAAIERIADVALSPITRLIGEIATLKTFAIPLLTVATPHDGVDCFECL